MKDNILVIQPYGIGDALFMLPLLKALKQQKNAERIDLILGSRTSQIVKNSGYCDEIFVIDKDRWRAQGKMKTLLEKLRLFLKLRNKKYTVFIDLSMQPEYAFWAKFLLRIPLRTGFNYKKKNRFLNQPLNLPSEGFVDKHVIEYFCDLGRILGIEILDKKPELRISEDLLQKTKNRLASMGVRPGQYIVISPGGGVTWGNDAYFKQWPIDYFRQLADLINTRLNIKWVVVLGSKKENQLGEYLKNNMCVGVANLCGETDLMEAAAMIKMSSLFLGNDGGLVHLAVTQGTPIIALYGPADQNVYGAYPDKENIAKLSKNLPCQPCYKSFRYKKDCKSLSCLKDLTPQEVFSTLEKSNFLKN